MAKLGSLAEIEPIKHLAARVTIPLAYAEGREFPWPVGSGTLLRGGDRLFILTAAHIFDKCDIDKFWIPSDRVGGRPIPIGRAKLHRPTDTETFDLAVVELLEHSTRQAAANNWGSIPLSSVTEPTLDGTFFLFGYPSSRLRPEGKTLMCSLITACTQRLEAPPAGATEPISDIDLFFLYDTTAEDEDGNSVESPHLHGVSGGGVWEILNASPGELWVAEKYMRLVGVQSSTMHGEWFRAKLAVSALGAASR